MTDEQLIAEYIKKHGVTKIPEGQSGLSEYRWKPEGKDAGKLVEVDKDGRFFTRKDALATIARRRQAKFKAYALGQKIKKAEKEARG